MADISGLSKKEIQEEYEDLVFRKVMAIYVQKEGKQILSEIEEEKKNDDTVVDSKAIVKLYDKKERRENLNILWKYSKKLVQFAAMVVFVAIISLSSVVVAFADVREAVVDAIYHLVYEDNERYTEISKGEYTGFIDQELYNWEGAYAPTYIPEGFIFIENTTGLDSHTHTYEKGDEFILIEQKNINYTTHIDTEDASLIKEVIINDSVGLLVEKNGLSYVSWSCGDTLFFICGNISSAEIIRVSEGLRIIK